MIIAQRLLLAILLLLTFLSCEQMDSANTPLSKTTNLTLGLNPNSDDTIRQAAEEFCKKNRTFIP